MSDENASEEQPVEPPGGKNKLLIILVVTNLLVVAGAAVAVVLAMGSSSQAEAEEPSAEELGPLVEVLGIVVNLDEQGGSHYLRAGFQVEITDLERQPEVEARMVPIRSALMLYFSGLTVEQTQGQENRQQILDHVVELANEQIGSELVRRAYFTEFVAQ